MFGIKLIFLRSELNVATFWICIYGHYVLRYKSFLTIFLIDATDRSKISSDQTRLFFAVSLYPLSVFSNTPFKLPFFNVIPQKQFFDNFYVYIGAFSKMINVVLFSRQNSEPSPSSCNWGPIGLAVLTFIGYKHR